MSSWCKTAVAVITIGCTWGVASAHHSIDSEIDQTKPAMVDGNVTKVEWANPHVLFHVDAKDAAGLVESWEIELGSPNALIRYGWSRATLLVGSRVVVNGYLARDGRKFINARTVKLADGRTVYSGSSYRDGKQTARAPGL